MTEEEVLTTVTRAAEQLAAELPLADNELRVHSAIDQCLEHLATTNVWGTANRLPSGRLWDRCGHWLQHGALLHRARFKPRGYAGDDVMLRQICENWRCDHSFGRWLDAYFQSHAAPKAVRNRTRIVAEAIVARAQQRSHQITRVASVGSGPAIDLTWGASQLAPEDRQRLAVTLLDLDPQALEDAASRVTEYLSREQVQTARENLYRLPSRSYAGELLAADLIACTGFCDYLGDDDAMALLRSFWQALRPGGRLLVFNFAPHNPSRGLMEWIGNWYLVYRDAEAMADLAARAGIPPHAFRIDSEQEGIDLFIDARRDA